MKSEVVFALITILCLAEGCSVAKECFHCIRMGCYWMKRGCAKNPDLKIDSFIIPPFGTCPTDATTPTVPSSTTTVTTTSVTTTSVTTTNKPAVENADLAVGFIVLIIIGSVILLVACIVLLKFKNKIFNILNPHRVDMHGNFDNPLYDDEPQEQRLQEAIELNRITIGRGGGN